VLVTATCFSGSEVTDAQGGKIKPKSKWRGGPDESGNFDAYELISTTATSLSGKTYKQTISSAQQAYLSQR